MAYELIETIEVGSGGAASIEFTSIPQDGVDLVLVTSLRSTGGSTRIRTEINGDTSGFDNTNIVLQGDGSSASSTINTSNGFDYMFLNYSTQTSNTFSSGSLYMSNYTSSADKSASIDSVNENNATAVNHGITASVYSGSSLPITSLKLTSGVDLAQYSTASLYKIY